MMAKSIKQLKADIGRDLFGMTPNEAAARKVCIACKKPVDLTMLSAVDRDEYRISRLCPACWNTLTAEGGEDE